MRHGRFTVGDLGRVADDGRHYEVVNGSLLATPPAAYPHNRRAQHVGLLLLAALPAGLEVLLTGTQAVELEDAVILVIEVTSPGNCSHDTVTKLERYARVGIPHYWIIDPELITVYQLMPGSQQYRQVAAGRRVQVIEPFSLIVTLPR